MKTVISFRRESSITLPELVERLQCGERITVAYKARSEQPYYAIFMKTDHHNHYGFMSPFVECNISYKTASIRDSITTAFRAGKELLVFERNEMKQLFNIKED